MRRRHFAGTLAGAGLAPAASAAAATGRRANTKMHVGGDYHSVAGAHITSRENLEYNLRYGVKHLTAQIRKRDAGGSWDLDELRRMKADCDQMGVIFEAIRMEPDYITYPKGAERDRALANAVANIQKAAEIGVPIITYHWTVIPIRRNQKTRGRGNVEYTGFRLEEDWRSLPEGKSGRVPHEEYWDRIGRFLQTVVPVARRHGVFLACHPYDPPGLPFGYQGADNWDSPGIFEAIKRYEAVVESPHNGFQLCLGTTAEGLKKPRTEILPIVQYLAGRGKIQQIHMRNIRGGLGRFEEVFPDEGELDFFRILRILRDTQFAGALCPDHMPHHAADPGSLQSFAFGYGYIQAMIQAVNSEVGAP